MTWSERSEYATLSMLLLPGLAVFPPVTQWHPSTALCHHSLFPLPSCGQNGPGDLLCFLSLGARKLYSGMLWGTSWSFPCTVWYAVTCQMYQSHGSSGWETDLSIWMALLRKIAKKQHLKAAPQHTLTTSLLIQADYLGSVLASLLRTVRTISLPDCLILSWRERGMLLLSGGTITSKTNWEVV